jgi:hypothetical protein
MNTKTEINLAPGIAGILFAGAIVATGFLMLGVRIVPFGGLAVAGVLMCAAQIYRRRTNAPGYAAPFVALLLVGGGLAMPSLASV